MRSLNAAAAVVVISVLASACAHSARALNPTSPSVSNVVDASASLSDVVSGSMAGPKEGKGRPDNPGNGHGKPENPGKGNGNGGGTSNPANPGNGKPEQPGRPEEPGRPESPGNSDHAGNPGHGSDHGTPSGPVKRQFHIQGYISAIGAESITVDEQVVAVPATARIEHGSTQLTFADLHVGTKVHVRGTADDDGLVAGQINVQED